MERPVKGDIVVVSFPFSDLTSVKKRPALVVAALTGEDIILAQVTSVTHSDGYSIPLDAHDFKQGSLPRSSVIRLNKLFTADKSLVLYKAGSLSEQKVKDAEGMLVKIFTM